MKGYDAAKKVSGIKRHIAVDTQGLPHPMHIIAADVTDRSGAVEMIGANRAGLARAWNVLADGGYSGEPFRTAVKDLVVARVEIAKRNELHKFVVMPAGWWRGVSLG